MRTLDRTHSVLSYVEGSLKNATIVDGNDKGNGFIFSLLNPPVPLGGNIVGLDIYVDEMPVPRRSVLIATSDDVVNAAVLSDTRPLPFKPFQSARFLIFGIDLDQEKKHKIIIMSKLEGFEQIIIPFTIQDYVSNKKEKVLIPSNLSEEDDTTVVSESTIFKNFTAPLVLSGKKAYIVCSSNGSLSANWTWMGTRYDNGGLYVPPARAFGRVIVEISVDDGVRKRLPNFVASSKHENGILVTRHEVAGLSVIRKLFVPIEKKGFIMIIEFNFDKLTNEFVKVGADKRVPRRKIRAHFMIDGNITSYGLAAISQSNFSRFYKSNNCLQIRTLAKKEVAHYYGTIGIVPKQLKPSRILTDSFDNDLELSYDLEIEEGNTKEIALIAAGSFTSPKDCLDEYNDMRENYKELLEKTNAHFSQVAKSGLSVTHSCEITSNVSKLARAFEKAKVSLEYLKANYDKLGYGICAGLPRFPNYWARDTGWSLRGYLAMGDYNFALQVIENFLKHQAKRSTKYALKGELPMIISGKYFLHNTTYGSADSTFLFPWALREYVYGTGDKDYLKKRWNSIIDLVNWGFLKDIDKDGLVEHGFSGIAEKLPIQDSTWMDHIDRRKNANDVQALFYENLMIGSELAQIVDDQENARFWSTKAEKLRNKIDTEYWDAKTGHYYDTIMPDGSKDESVRPNSLVLLLTDTVKDQKKASIVLDRIEREDMTASWGVRTLSNLDEKYHPTLYHDGAVWPLVTGWATVSEIKSNRSEQALRYLSIMAAGILKEHGMYAETYRGDRPEPFNSCILQAWSVGLYVYAFREMMLGTRINMIDNKIRFEPKIPDSIAPDSGTMSFEQQINTSEGPSNLTIAICPGKQSISIRSSNPGLKLPEFVSDTYSINLTK